MACCGATLLLRPATRMARSITNLIFKGPVLLVFFVSLLHCLCRRYGRVVAGFFVFCLTVPAVASPVDVYVGKQIHAIKVAGNVKVEEDAILHALVSKVGQTLKSETIETDIRSLWSMAYFRDVKVDARLVSDSPKNDSSAADGLKMGRVVLTRLKSIRLMIFSI